MISNMTNSELINLLAILFSFVTVFMGMYFYMLQKSRYSQYDEEKKKIELDMLRHNFESQVYALNERVNKNPSKWKEAYHLQLDGNNTTDKRNYSRIYLNDFLISSGIKKDDLIEEDFVFVLTPFHSKYDDVFNAIQAVCSQAGIRCIRGDEENFKSDIFSHVLKNIVKAKVVIANLSGRNPNVLYELGIAHALNKTTIMVSQLLDDLPVDVKSKRIVVYKNAKDLETTLPIELLKAMRDASHAEIRNHSEIRDRAMKRIYISENNLHVNKRNTLTKSGKILKRMNELEEA